MFDKISKGQWWDRALTLVEGCTPVSEGCDNCWSAAMGRRFGNWPEVGIRIREDRLELPLRVKKPTAWAVWNDLFHEDVSDYFIERALLSMHQTQRHIFLVLTKRPERIKSIILNLGQWWVFDNIWLGVTAENQEQADKRIPILLQIPAAVRFVSVEPMLGPVSLRWIHKIHDGRNTEYEGLKQLDWIICRGESGPHARPMHPDWVRSLRDQCQVAGVPFFFKQMYVDDKLVKAPVLGGKQYLELPTNALPYILQGR